MEQFVWTDDLNLGIDIIDAQHRRIVDYIAEIGQAIEQQDAALVFDVMERLKDYTLDHFSFEEQLMQKAGYVLCEAHQAKHRRFEDKVERLSDSLRQGDDPFGVARRIRNTLMAWLIQHIKHEDIDYVPVVKKVLAKEQSWISGALNRIFNGGVTQS
ncbi:bacteriohemerythrin [Bacterioplanes sanyensis]|uniref:bacteriohemerythrin n=1 Tax=Bacterioplanes sanyensis TaxID=1249553 RepID=UPI0016765848|nr:bacteriohemerythrin [Bacterioplanes sanyensis]GGY47577.1 bacteriohemerythrin [Bacterioplanes sanyensis]